MGEREVLRGLRGLRVDDQKNKNVVNAFPGTVRWIKSRLNSDEKRRRRRRLMKTVFQYLIIQHCIEHHKAEGFNR